MILITGATGFLGAELVLQLLKIECKVKCTKRVTSIIPKALEIEKDKIEWIELDLLDIGDLEQAFENVDIVYHCAATISFDKSTAKKTIKNNTEVTSNIVNLCLKFKVNKLIHVSSIAALGKSKNGALITEEDYWDAFDIHNSYAISKYYSEMEVWRGIEEGLNAIIVNPSVIIGKQAGWNGSGLLFKSIKNGLKFYTNGSIGLVDVSDVVNCMILLESTPKALNQRFIINAENLMYKNLFESIAKAFNVTPPSIEAKPWMLKLIWRLKEIKNLFLGKSGRLNQDIIESAFMQQNYDNQKIVKLLNYHFKPIDISIKEITNDLKNQLSA